MDRADASSAIQTQLVALYCFSSKTAARLCNMSKKVHKSVLSTGESSLVPGNVNDFGSICMRTWSRTIIPIAVVCVSPPRLLGSLLAFEDKNSFILVFSNEKRPGRIQHLD
ncbi:hypothetical protein ACOME3_000642 [Neoechinorhynchus agilis]